jgi:hypothetical protein
MPTTEAIESGNVDVERVEECDIEGSPGSFDSLSPLPIVAVTIVLRTSHWCSRSRCSVGEWELVSRRNTVSYSWFGRIMNRVETVLLARSASSVAHCAGYVSPGSNPHTISHKGPRRAGLLLGA